MRRDLSTITRQLDDFKNNDIEYRKHQIFEALRADPDIQYVLNRKEKLPLNSYADPKNPTKDELAQRQRILLYNKNIQKSQIIPFLKVNEIQTAVQNMIMFDISDERVSYTNKVIKHQVLTVMCFVHEDDMDTEFPDITRVDLLSYLVCDIINWSNETGLHWELQSNIASITDTKYYVREIKFLVKTPNGNNFRNGTMRNSYE